MECVVTFRLFMKTQLIILALLMDLVNRGVAILLIMITIRDGDIVKSRRNIL